MRGPAKLLKTAHPRTPWCVVYTDPEKRERSGRKKRIPKWFSDESKARAYEKELNKHLVLVGTVGHAMDAATRADYWAGRQILDAAGHLKTSFRELAERHAQRVPSGGRSPRLLGKLQACLDYKQHTEGATDQTLTNLRNRLKQWWERDHVLTFDDINREAIKRLRDRAGAGAETRRNDMAAASSFCSWAVEQALLAANPVLGMKRPKVIRGRPPIWQNDEAAALLRETRAYAKGKYLPAVVLMLANLRPSEVPHARITYGHRPFVRLEGDAGKMRGRANRVVPLWPAAVAWLKLAKKPTQGIRPLNNMGRKKICRKAGLTWKADICRHTAISNRGAILNDDAKLAREAGTSETMIFRRYHRARTPAEARGFYGIKPSA